jgi:hypothetical protein
VVVLLLRHYEDAALLTCARRRRTTTAPPKRSSATTGRATTIGVSGVLAPGPGLRDSKVQKLVSFGKGELVVVTASSRLPYFTPVTV